MKSHSPARFRGHALTAALFLTCLTAHAQWTTEQFELKAGWNAVYLHIDASHATLNQLVGSDPENPIEEIWVWSPPGPALQFFDSLQAPQSGSTEWLRWDRYWAGASPMQRLPGNAAALVRVADGTPDYTWTLVGKPVPPAQRWTSSGMNFIGFPTPRTSPPTWGDFLGPARSLHDHAEIYRYVGGPFSATNPQRIHAPQLRNTPLHRNQAYWVRSEEYNRYFGPFEVELQHPNGIQFGTRSGQFRIRIRNRIEEPVTVTARLLPSGPAPAGEPVVAGNVPLLLRGEQDMSDLTFPFTRFSEEDGAFTLAPVGQAGANIEVVVGLDRFALEGIPGDHFAGILRVSDDAGMTLIDLPVSAGIASTEGLWVGNALVGEVAHYLVDYAVDGTGGLAQDEDGAYIAEEIDESFGAVARAFPLRLIIHNNGSGNATLLQRVYHGMIDDENTVLTKDQSVLHPDRLASARRISAAHLPWTSGNASWTFNGPLNEAAEIETTVFAPYDDHAANPFVHTYHPDHDNLDARFEQTLPQGVESYGIERRITLRVQAPGGDFANVTAGSGTLSGTYEETVLLHGRDGASRTYRSRGAFALNRVSEIATLTD
ncbi:MAG: hypothetical protein JJU00_00585 [Opitutales bacterium]|nr:hypothetical protein [Opitutales bacterium]